MLYHYSIGFPDGIAEPDPEQVLTYSRHAMEQVAKKFANPTILPNVVGKDYRIIEVETIGNEVNKWVLRLPWHATEDLVLVVNRRGFVLTVWGQYHTDHHSTLDRSRYIDPETGGFAA